VNAGGLLPESEALRRAMFWLAEQPQRTAGSIEAASHRFDLSPLESAVLYRWFGLQIEHADKQ